MKKRYDYSTVKDDRILLKSVDQLSYNEYIGNMTQVYKQRDSLLKRGYTLDQIELAKRHNKNLHKKRECVRRRVDRILWACKKYEFHAFFCTFTLNNSHIDDGMEKIKRHLVRSLTYECVDYVANEDYGEHDNRLHFHAVILCERPISKLRLYQYGFQYLEPIGRPDRYALSEYTTKLTCHARKDSTGRAIYARCTGRYMSKRD